MSIRERLFGTEPPHTTVTTGPSGGNAAGQLDPTLARIDNALGQSVQDADVLVISGANCQPFPVATRTVREVRETLAYIMNIDPNATALVNGGEVPPEYVLQQDDTLEFTKEGGEKGGPEYQC
jgi:hypothetical protein